MFRKQREKDVTPRPTTSEELRQIAERLKLLARQLDIVQRKRIDNGWKSGRQE